MAEDDDVFGASCSNRTVFLNLTGCSSCYQCGRLILFSSFCLVLATCDRMSIRHLLLVPGFHKHISCTSFQSSSFSFTRSVSATLSSYAFILAFPVKVLSIFVLVRSQHSLLCGFVALPCDASAAQPGRPPV